MSTLMICYFESQIPRSMKWGIIIKFEKENSWHVADISLSHHPPTGYYSCILWSMNYICDGLILIGEHAGQVSVGEKARWRDWPTTWMYMSAESDTFSIWTDRVYFPEWVLSAERMKKMLSTSLVRVPTVLSSRRTSSLNQVTIGRGLPCSYSDEKRRKKSRFLFVCLDNRNSSHASYIVNNVEFTVCFQPLCQALGHIDRTVGALFSYAAVSSVSVRGAELWLAFLLVYFYF